MSNTYRNDCPKFPEYAIFIDAAMEALSVCTKGYPRLVNKLAVRALLHGFQRKAEQVDADLIRIAALEYKNVAPMTRTYREGRILYDTQTERWEIWDVYPYPVAVHCGESFEMKVGEDFLPCRIEMDFDWVIYFRNTRFHLHPDVSYWIRVG